MHFLGLGCNIGGKINTMSSFYQVGSIIYNGAKGSEYLCNPELDPGFSQRPPEINPELIVSYDEYSSMVQNGEIKPHSIMELSCIHLKGFFAGHERKENSVKNYFQFTMQLLKTPRKTGRNLYQSDKNSVAFYYLISTGVIYSLLAVSVNSSTKFY